MRILLLLLVLVAGQAWAATWYVTRAGAGAANGTSEANAFAGFADAWATAGDIDAGDTLCIIGTFTGTADSQVAGGSPWMIRVLDEGTAGNPITLDGDCDGDGTRAVLDGNSEASVGIKMDTTAAMPKYITVKNLEIKNFISVGISAFRTAATDEGVDQFHIYDNLHIHDITNGSSTGIGFTGRGGEIDLTDSVIEDTGDDAVFMRGRNFRVDNLTTRRFSLVSTTGDGIQIAGGPGNGYHVSNFTCVDTRDMKQCFIASALTDTGALGILEDFHFAGVAGGTTSNGAYITGVGAIVRRGFVTGFNRGVDFESEPNAASMTLESVIAVGATQYGIHIPVGSGTGNTIRHSVSSGATKGIYIEHTGAQTIVNSAAIGASGCGIDRVTGSAAESYSASSGNGTNYCLDGASTAAGTGSISTAPAFVGGTTPTTHNGFRLSASSPLRSAGTNVGPLQDYGNRRFESKPSIGAWSVGSGDARTTVTPR